MRSHLKLFLILFVFLLAGNGLSQMSFNGQWESIGPNKYPDNPEFRIDAGTGPVEFIRVYQKKEGYLLAGSLLGGLFFSENGGEQWINAGSDRWNYSGCAWADFYPEDENTWFACSNYSDNNGKPGSIGKRGGILRTNDAGTDWDLIGDYHDFGGFPQIRIYGTRFHPVDPNLMFALTSEGLYYTEDCLADFVKWNRVPNLKGWVYDLDFLNGEMFVTNFFHGKWSLLQFNQDNYLNHKKVGAIEEERDVIRNLTIEPIKDNLLVAKDFEKKSDELIEFSPESGEMEVVLKNQRIGFGSGYTFGVDPNGQNSFFLGYGTRINKWSYPEMKKEKIGSNYHVDVENVAFDPFDPYKVYLATHGGVFISYNNGESWEERSDGLGIAQVMGMAVAKNNPNLIAIGCYHDGSMLYADFEKNGNASWRTVNGGDGLIPLIDPTNNAMIYTSNQYVGGGLFFSKDSALRNNKNIHHLNGYKTSGWELAAVMHPTNSNTIFFNFMESRGDNKGNINVCRSQDVTKEKSAERISDFYATHGLKKYKVYGLYNSPHHPDQLYAYVLHYEKGEDGKTITNHRLFKNGSANADAKTVRENWYELKHPLNTWIADLVVDGYKSNRIYLSYTKGKEKPESIFGDKGMIYTLIYKEFPPYKKRKEIDISRNLPNSVAGRFNLVYRKTDLGGGVFIATRTGVYYGKKRVLKGKSRWQKVGFGLPHCKVYGLDFNEEEKVLTVAFFGRGVWQYHFQ